MDSFDTGLPYVTPELRQAWGYYPQFQQVTKSPEPLLMGSKDPSCQVCGGPSNFSCPYCEKVNYCTHKCQVKRQC